MPERPQIDILLPRAMHTDLSRRLFLGGLVGAGATAALAACAPSTGGGGGGGASGVLNLYTWGPYDDPKVLKQFAKDKGPTIKLGSYDSNQEMIAKLVAAKGTSGYDLVVPTIGFVPQMVAGGLLEKLDHSKLPNLKNVESSYLNLSFDKGNVYSVPKDFGATGFAYDTTVIKRDLTSWADFFDAAQKEASGHTSLVADPDEILWAYFFSIGEDINTSDTAKLNAARDWLVKNIAPHIQKFESYPSDTIAQNGVVLAHAWNGDARQGILGNKDPSRYKFVKPSEGAGLFLDTWAIPTGAKNSDAAHELINYVLDPDVSFKELAYIGYDTAVKGVADKAKASGSGIELPDLIFYTDEEAKKLVFDIVPKSEQLRLSIFNDLQAAAG